MPATRKQYSSVENRFQTPLKLPNLRTPGSKKQSNATTNNTLKQQQPSNLSTVVESNYSKVHPNGRICPICAKKMKIGQPHNHSNQQSYASQSGTGVKGAPYYQPMSL